MTILVHAVDHPGLAPFSMPDRFRHDITYFAAHPSDEDVPELGAAEYWIRKVAARTILDDGVLLMVSPLDSNNRTEIEISEEQEDWLVWIVENEIQHVRLG